MAPDADRQSDQRDALRAIRELLSHRPDFGPRYESAKSVIRHFRRPAFYEVSQRCNLWCEGCYYFEDEKNRPVTETESEAAWEAFFASEAARGVSMGYFVGAETALHQERMFAARRHLPQANIGTNGTIFIDRAIDYRIGVSVWASDEVTDRRLRGASVFQKALKNYQGDPRAIILFTVSPWNLAGLPILAEMCREHGLPLTFNMYSPTSTFLEKLQRREDNDSRYFRVSRPESTPCFSAEDLTKARAAILDVMERFPQTVVYSRAYNEWATQDGPLFEVDSDTGVAVRCGSLIGPHMNYYAANMRQKEVKCCTSGVDCGSCRMYSAGWSSQLAPTMRHVVSEFAFSNWLDMIETIDRIFLFDRAHDRSAAEPLAAAI